MNNLYQNAEALKPIIPKDKTITLVGGGFDLIHVGHVHVLKYAASLEDLLVVAVLSDNYIRSYKGVKRPIINQEQRAVMVASIRYVDFVYISDESPSSTETLMLFKPASVVFGQEVNIAKDMRERRANIKSASPGTRIKTLPRYDEEEVSTGHIINKIREEKF